MLYLLILFIDLKAFIQIVTGCPVPVGNIAVTFTQHPEAVAANTYGRADNLIVPLFKKTSSFLQCLPSFLGIITQYCETQAFEIQDILHNHKFLADVADKSNNFIVHDLPLSLNNSIV